jgi:hypothetical protein
MTETAQNITVNEQKTTVFVFIDGDKSAFVSKAAVDKFKQSIKTNSEANLSDLVTKFVKPEYNLELVSSENNEYKYKVIVKAVNKQPKVQKEKTESEQRRELLRAKVKLMANARTNSDYYKAKSAGNVDNEILVEYQKLKKMTKMAIPEPSEILANPEQYKPMLSMVLSNPMMRQHGSSHPYVRYFKLLAEKIGATEILPVPTQNFGSSSPSSMEEMMKTSNPVEIKQVSGNSLNVINEDADTDTEDEAEDNIDV